MRISSLKKALSSPFALAIIAIILLLLSFFFYSTTLYRNLKDEVISTLREASQQTAVALRNQVSGEQRAIEDVALMLSTKQHPPLESLGALKGVAENHHLLRMGIIERNGKAITTDGKTLYLAMRPYFRAAFQRKSSVSDRLLDVVDGRAITVYAAPIYDASGERVNSVLFGTYSIERFQSSLSSSLFDGAGYSYVVTSTGEAISSSSTVSGKSEFENIISKLKELDPENEGEAVKLGEGMLSGENGYIEFSNKTSEVNKYMYYTPLGVNKWYLLTIVPADVLNKKMFLSMALTGFLGFIIFAVSYVVIRSIMNSRKKWMTELENMLFVNKITGNSTYEKFKIDAKEILAKKYDPDRYVIISVDIDKFKYINDMFGYKEGDNLIAFIDSVFVNNCDQGELAAHINADNFVLLLKYTSKEKLRERLELLRCQIEEYKETYKKNYEITLSIGIYKIDDIDRYVNLDVDLIKDRATIPQKQVKNNKHMFYAFYDENFRKKILMERDIENNMLSALKNREFIVKYQPKFSMRDGKIIGAEAIVRWIRSDGTMMKPDSFIYLFEENDFITVIDNYVFRQVCADLRKWIDKGYDVVPISSNLSRKNIVIPNIASEYDAIAASFGIPKELTGIEITETALIENEDAIVDFVKRMRSKGFPIIIDDFGTGFSSLGMLMNIEIDTLKIDRSFVAAINENVRSYELLKVGVRLLHRWGITVNVEGIETLQQYERLKHLRCDEAQGFYLSKPLAAHEFEKLLAENERRPALSSPLDKSDIT